VTDSEAEDPWEDHDEHVKANHAFSKWLIHPAVIVPGSLIAPRSDKERVMAALALPDFEDPTAQLEKHERWAAQMEKAIRSDELIEAQKRRNTYVQEIADRLAGALKKTEPATPKRPRLLAIASWSVEEAVCTACRMVTRIPFRLTYDAGGAEPKWTPSAEAFFCGPCATDSTKEPEACYDVFKRRREAEQATPPIRRAIPNLVRPYVAKFETNHAVKVELALETQERGYGIENSLDDRIAAAKREIADSLEEGRRFWPAMQRATRTETSRPLDCFPTHGCPR